MKITKEKLKQLIKEELENVEEIATMHGEQYELLTPEGNLKGRVDPEDVIRVASGDRYIKDHKDYKIKDLINAVSTPHKVNIPLLSDEPEEEPPGWQGGRWVGKGAVDEVFGGETKKLRSKGAALAKKLSAAKSLVPFFDKLRASDEFEKAQFLAGMANNLGVNIADALSVLKTQQKRLDVSQPAGPTKAPEEKL
jgi:hypothetical protein